MNEQTGSFLRVIAFSIGLLAALPATFCQNLELSNVATFKLGNSTAMVKSVETMPYIESDYTKRFRFDSAQNPKLKELRTRFGLEEVIAPGKDEFSSQVLLMDWVHNRFKKFGQPSRSTKGALEILDGIEEGQTFFCVQYAQLMASTAASVGWVNRVLALRRHQDAGRGGSTEHSTTEIWSNQHRKWVMLDPTSNMYLEKDGIPLNAYEIRNEWFYKQGKELVFVVGKEKQKYRKSDLPVLLKHFTGFGDLAINLDELDKYGFIGYIPNTDLMNSGFDYGQMFIVKDQLCEGTQWHKRLQPANPASDPYFPINQAALNLHLENEKLIVEIKTLTPNLKQFERRLNNGEWKVTSDTFEWTIEPRANRLEVRSLNAFGVAGPTSSVEVQME
jgi:hypothetical protein